MKEFREVVGEGICSMLPLWRVLLALELTFLALLGLTAALSSEPPNVAFQFSLLFIVPTTVALLFVLYYCGRR